MNKIKVLAFYKFTQFDSLSKLKLSLLNYCSLHKVLGSVLISNEGLNGTIAGYEKNIDTVLSFFQKLPGCMDLEHKVSFASEIPFSKLRVRLKKEIVTMGCPEVKPSQSVGSYVNAKDWNNFIKQDDVVLIDTRNDYEVAIGTFDGSVNPKTQKFRDFPNWWDKNSERYKDKKIAMFCTGGIRCEKATNFLIQNNHKNVFHLKGGILKYLEDVPIEESKWQGECFVFDQRVSVTHGLEEGNFSLCFACRRPISEIDKAHVKYEEGVSCHKCFNQHSLKRKDGFRERQRQINQKAL
ncbi:MAG: rhodanese-related sulfurtransferase [Paracoccaceae bacterium]|nr:rhodanese-related sulfurtransferase [Paracoccaceae bacterium]